MLGDTVSSGLVMVPPLAWQSGTSLVLVQRYEVVLQQAVDEDVAAADFAQEDAFSGIVEGADDIPG
jgi:hypothetical protein